MQSNNSQILDILAGILEEGDSYRIPEAQQVLADPEQVRKPVLTIALDLGYGSLGPFNRAFKATTGQTPTEFRQRAVAESTADSE